MGQTQRPIFTVISLQTFFHNELDLATSLQVNSWSICECVSTLDKLKPIFSEVMENRDYCNQVNSFLGARLKLQHMEMPAPSGHVQRLS